MHDSIGFYATIMMGESPLTRVQREMLATVVSAENRCHY
jgi:alkylhydroperoxidase family enzyme